LVENLVSINFPKKNPEKDDDPSWHIYSKN
jgi:hypothetical protein